MVSPEDVLTPQELAARLKVPLTWVFEKTRRRQNSIPPIPVFRIGRYLRFSWSDVSAWMESTRKGGAPRKVATQ